MSFFSAYSERTAIRAINQRCSSSWWKSWRSTLPSPLSPSSLSQILFLILYHRLPTGEMPWRIMFQPVDSQWQSPESGPFAEAVPWLSKGNSAVVLNFKNITYIIMWSSKMFEFRIRIPCRVFSAVFWIRILIQIRRIRMFLGLPDPHPDPLVTSTDPDTELAPDLSLFS